MARDENIKIFQDTEKQCQTSSKLKTAIQESNNQQQVILESDLIENSHVADPQPFRFTGPARLVVSQKRSFEAASAYEDLKVCVHNFASATNPGGGVVHGSSAQEEALCRCSTLYFNLNKPDVMNVFYYPHRYAGNPLHNDDCIYTPDVVVFKTDTASPKMLPESEWFLVDVLTCAAPHLREQPSNSFNRQDGDVAAQIMEAELYAIHVKRLHRMLDIAVANGAEVMILGAFGCGAFANPPETVARAMKSVIMERLHDFKVIEFAVFCPPGNKQNYEVFQRVMKEDI